MTWHADERPTKNEADADAYALAEVLWGGHCEDYPCCGHTPQDPCTRQPYDEPDYYDTSRPGNEHALCDHENGDCNVDYEPDEWDEDE